MATPLIDDDELDDLEREFVARVRGRVLEIGAGDGENFGAFDPSVDWVGLEPDAKRRAELATRAREWRHAAEPLAPLHQIHYEGMKNTRDGGSRRLELRRDHSSSNELNGGTLVIQKPARPPCWSTSM